MAVTSTTKIANCRYVPRLVPIIPNVGRFGDSAQMWDVRFPLASLRFGFPSTRDTKAVKNHARGIGTIESIKMNSGYVVIEKIVTLFQGKVNAYALHHFGIVFAALYRAEKSCRKAGAPGQLCDPL